ncbi:MAG: ribosome biogenesis GTP-binding protein YihA/YsxC [Chlamydiales bacterium]
MNFRNVRFLISAPSAKEAPRHFAQEFAVVGRSNVGKSSLLNDLFQYKGIAKTSCRPGKTQLLNFFSIDEKLLCVDLPGYGYAKVPKAMKREWGEILESFLQERESINLVLFLADIRRLPSDGDLQMYAWLKAKEIPTILVLTKVDKVSSNERSSQTKKNRCCSRLGGQCAYPLFDGEERGAPKTYNRNPT